MSFKARDKLGRGDGGQRKRVVEKADKTMSLLVRPGDQSHIATCSVLCGPYGLVLSIAGSTPATSP